MLPVLRPGVLVAVIVVVVVFVGAWGTSIDRRSNRIDLTRFNEGRCRRGSVESVAGVTRWMGWTKAVEEVRVGGSESVVASSSMRLREPDGSNVRTELQRCMIFGGGGNRLLGDWKLVPANPRAWSRTFGRSVEEVFGVLFVLALWSSDEFVSTVFSFRSFWRPPVILDDLTSQPVVRCKQATTGSPVGVGLLFVYGFRTFREGRRCLDHAFRFGRLCLKLNRPAASTKVA